MPSEQRGSIGTSAPKFFREVADCSVRLHGLGKINIMLAVREDTPVFGSRSSLSDASNRGLRSHTYYVFINDPVTLPGYVS
jgi:hypothetical protein